MCACSLTVFPSAIWSGWAVDDVSGILGKSEWASALVLALALALIKTNCVIKTGTANRRKPTQKCLSRFPSGCIWNRKHILGSRWLNRSSNLCVSLSDIGALWRHGSVWSLRGGGQRWTRVHHQRLRQHLCPDRGLPGGGPQADSRSGIRTHAGSWIYSIHDIQFMICDLPSQHPFFYNKTCLIFYFFMIYFVLLPI